MDIQVRAGTSGGGHPALVSCKSRERGTGVRVAELADGYFPSVGGGAAAISSWINALPDVDFEVITNHLPGTSRFERTKENCTVRRFLPTDFSQTAIRGGALKAGVFSYKLVSEWIRFSRKMAHLRGSLPDIVHFNGPITNYGFFAMDRFVGRPLLTTKLNFSALSCPKLLTLHGLPSLWTRSIVDVENERKHVGSFDAIVVVDKYMMDLVSPIARSASPPRPVAFIPNGVDTKVFDYRDPPPGNELCAGFLGRLDSGKGARLISDIARSLPKGVSLRLALAGKTSSLAQELSRYDRVQICANLAYESVPSFLGSIHLLLNPLLIPGVSRATLEAMCIGRPVVMPPGPDRYPVVDGETGFLCPPSAPELVSLLERASGELPRLEAMGRRCREIIAREYSSTVLANRLMDVFRKVQGRGS